MLDDSFEGCFVRIAGAELLRGIGWLANGRPGKERSEVEIDVYGTALGATCLLVLNLGDKSGNVDPCVRCPTLRVQVLLTESDGRDRYA